MPVTSHINWTNKSALALAQGEDPIDAIRKIAQKRVLEAIDAGYTGPPFNPLTLAEMLGIPVEADASIADARTVPTVDGIKIQFNPNQIRERIRFSLAHEIAHSFFPDVRNEVRNRHKDSASSDNWQLEMLCNLAAAEILMPLGSLRASKSVPPIEQLMEERIAFDVSAEAYLIRFAQVVEEPILMFCASPVTRHGARSGYRVNYAVPSPTWPHERLFGMVLPVERPISECTAIGYTSRGIMDWPRVGASHVECVGASAYPGEAFPRVLGLLWASQPGREDETFRFFHGNALEPRGAGRKIVCQLVNDAAHRWGGGIARATSKLFPDAEKAFGVWISNLSRSERLGATHFYEASDDIIVASLVAQHGFRPSDRPKIRYSALEECLKEVLRYVDEEPGASVHMPRLGTGAAGGDWQIIVGIIRNIFQGSGHTVTIYDLPPKRQSVELMLFP